MRCLFILTVALLLSHGAPAHADPCEAIPQKGPLPAYLSFGATFSGPVAYVIDGDSLCVAVAPGPQNWVEVRLADFYAPESSAPGGAAAKAALERLALGKKAACVASLPTYDRIAARCRIDGHPLGDLMRQAGVAEGGRAWKAPASGRSVSPSSARPVTGGGAFRNCAAARAAGVAPMRRGDPNYNPQLDGDGDGIACEPYRPR